MAKTFMITQELEKQKELNPAVYRAIHYFKDECVPRLQEQFPRFFLNDDLPKTLDARIEGLKFPLGHFLMSLWPDGRLAWGTPEQLRKLYGTRSEDVGRMIRKANISRLDSTEVADRIEKILEELLHSIAV